MGIGRFDGHTPPALLEANPPMRKFVKVLDGLQAYKQSQVEEYVAHFDPRTAGQVQVLRNYVDEFKGEYRPDTPARCLECLVMHKGVIYGQKGTRKGLAQWLTCITGASRVVVNYEGPYPFLHFQTMEGGVLPNGEDILAEKTRGYKIPTLLADTWLLGYTRISITIYGAYNRSAEFLAWLTTYLPRYLPMADGQTVTPTIRFR